jgi:hypothetical protein
MEQTRHQAFADLCNQLYDIRRRLPAHDGDDDGMLEHLVECWNKDIGNACEAVALDLCKLDMDGFIDARIHTMLVALEEAESELLALDRNPASDPM